MYSLALNIKRMQGLTTSCGWTALVLNHPHSKNMFSFITSCFSISPVACYPFTERNWVSKHSFQIILIQFGWRFLNAPALQSYFSFLFCFSAFLFFNYEAVTEGVMHFTHKKEATMHFADINQWVNKFNGKCHIGLTRFDIRVHLILYCIEDGVWWGCQGDSPTEIQNDPHTFWILSLRGVQVQQGISQPWGETQREVTPWGQVLVCSPVPCRGAQWALGCPMFRT